MNNSINPTISVIVPVYNTKDYIRNCLDSIINQTFSDIEVILVDDCSSDGTSALLDEIATADKRITVIHKSENSGVSESRNIGLQSSKGEYISFVDSDDWLDCNMYKELLECIKANDSDIVCGGYNLLCDGNNQIRNPIYPTNTVVNPDDAISYYIPKRRKGFFDGYIWDKLYKKESLYIDGKLHLFDRKYNYGEDFVWLIYITANCKRIAFYQDAVYCYRSERVGNTQSVKNKISYALSAEKACENAYYYIKNKGFSSANNVLRKLISHEKQLLLACLYNDEQKMFCQYEEHYLKNIKTWRDNEESLEAKMVYLCDLLWIKKMKKISD